MSDDSVELGLDGKPGPHDIPPRRRLFEGGSGMVPSSWSHKILNLQSEASNVREQAASLSSKAVIDAMQINDHNVSDQPIREDDEDSREEDSLIAYTTSNKSAAIADETASLDGIPSIHANGNDIAFPNSVNLSPCGTQLRPMPSNQLSRATAPELNHPTESQPKMGVLKLLSYFPAVLVGLLLNILDGLSYGMILFPLGTPMFANLEAAGLTLFYTSTIIAQLVFSLGGSGFKACIGSEMIEIVPFFHTLALSIARKLDGCSREEILATTIASFAFSCVITGLTFFLLGWLKLGTLVGFFPLHILLGCIGGVGWFLIATGVEVSSRLHGGLDYNLATLQYLFKDGQTIAQWLSCLLLGCVLMYAERRLHHPLVVPSILVGTFVLFHAVVALVPNLTLETVRNNGWVFPAQEVGEPWYWIYTFYRPSYIHITPILECIPVMLALTFFGIIHVPINIPALAAAIKEDSFNVNRELVAHGISNTLSGLLGSIQNYLVYTNSVMFIKSGADSSVAGILLAVATAALMVAGPGIIGVIPVIVVASLIFMMGFDLIAEALFDTYGSVRKQDYATMLAITLIMGCYDFVAGILVGIVLACLFFVISSARRSPVVAQMSGSHAHSTVIRHPVLQQYLSNVGKQVYVMRLSGALFFGTNGTLEKEVRKICDCHVNGGSASIKYLIIDLANVSDIDYCTVDTFLRLKRLLDSCRIRLVLSGAETAGHKIRGLKAADIVPEVVDYNDPTSVRVFATLNIALSWCENQFIKEYYRHKARFSYLQPAEPNSSQPRKSSPLSVPNTYQWGIVQDFGSAEGSPSVGIGMAHSAFGTTPRSSYIKTAAHRAAREDINIVNKWQQHQQPVALLMQTLGQFSSRDVSFWAKLAPHFESRSLIPSQRLPTGFHLIESGIIHVQYSSGYYETALAGTALGELSTQITRSADIWVESESVIWTLTQSELDKVRAAEGGHELVAELTIAYLALVSKRYQWMTEYYHIAASS